MKKLFYPLVCIALSVFCTNVYSQVIGPTQPEYNSIKPIDTKNLVSEFTGTFNYSIPVVTVPGPNGLSYPMTLVYTSGKSPNEAASWVGFGWDLNPGAIVRGKRGFPDDFKNQKILKWNRNLPDITINIARNVSGEVYSNNGIGMNIGFEKNNRRGVTSTYGLMTQLQQYGNYGLSWDSKGNIFASYQNSLLDQIQSYLDLSKLTTLTIPIGEQLFKTSVNSIVQNAAKSMGNSFLGIQSSIPLPQAPISYDGWILNYKPTLNLSGTEVASCGDNILCKTITMKDKLENRAYGYMYENLAKSDKYALIDYYKDNESGVTNRDKYLSIPFSSQDNFIVSGQGLQGAFQARKRTISHLRPGYVESTTMNYEAGVTQGIAPDKTSLGLDAKIGWDKLRIDGWLAGYKSLEPDAANEEFIFKFNNELTSSYLYNQTYAKSEELERPWDISSIGNPVGYSSDFQKRATIIEYYTLRRLKSINTTDGNPLLMRKQFNVEAADEDLIGAFSIVNTDGMRYNYGLPVFNRNERNLSYGINKANGNISFSPNGNLVYMSVTPESNNGIEPKVVRGEENNAAYAGSFLITEIYTPDYADVTGDGPTPDDLGGYVLFNYKRAAGDSLKNESMVEKWRQKGYTPSGPNLWYKWRYPYNGLNYEPGSLSDYQDDMGSVSMGETELYYLESIETKTHIAYFVTNTSNIVAGKDLNDKDISLLGSNVVRKDAFGAIADEYLASGTDNLTPPDGKLNQVQYLEKICLYAKRPSITPGVGNKYLAELLQTTFFQYDYSCWPTQPNSINNQGKLSLSRVWMEYQGVKNYGVSPYEFSYLYNTNIYDNLDPSYSAVATKIKNEISSLAQNPSYNPLNVDRWGYYCEDGVNRYNAMNPWVNQNPTASPTFDPAAWNLKSITLPTMGQIHVQYEQNEYCYVQDKRAMIMAKVSAMHSVDGMMTINLTDIFGYSPSVDEKNSYKLLCEALTNKPPSSSGFNGIISGDKAYFKALFSLEDNSPGLNCQSEFISGYANLSRCDIVDNNLEIVFSNSYSITDLNFPKYLCKDFYNNHRSGLIQPKKLVRDACRTYSYLGYLGVLGLPESFPLASCPAGEKVSLNHSYVRLPLPIGVAKKGGGIRVKRVLTYDSFDKRVESTADKRSRLNGVEYLYRTKDNNLPSGVATNEPGLGGEENVLASYIEKSLPSDNNWDISWSQAFIGPKQYEEFIGPLGRTLLPGASIGYSSVIKKSIFDGVNNGGVSIKTYYTCKDYPLKSVCSPITTQLDYPITIPFDMSSYPVPDILVPEDVLGYIKGSCVYKVSNNFMGQSYSFVKNGMHGAIRKEELYTGVVKETVDKEKSDKFDDLKRNGYTEYVYAAPGEKVNLFKFDADFSNTYNNQRFIGIDQDAVVETRLVEQTTKIPKMDLDLVNDLKNLAIPFYFTFKAGYDYIRNTLKTFVVSNVITYPTIVKSVITEVDGIKSVQDYIAYDYYTGAPCVTRSYDGYNGLNLKDAAKNSYTIHDGSYTSINVTAPHQYDALKPPVYGAPALKSIPNTVDVYRRIALNDPKYANDSNTFQIVFDFKPEAYRGNDNEVDFIISSLRKQFNKGDIIEVYPKDADIAYTQAEYYRVVNFAGNIVSIVPLWRNPAILQPYSFIKADIYLLRSALKNQLNLPALTWTTYGKSGANNLNITASNAPVASNPDRDNFVVALNNLLAGVCSDQPSTRPHDDYFTDQGAPVSMFTFKDINGEPFKVNSIDDLITVTFNETNTAPACGNQVEVDISANRITNNLLTGSAASDGAKALVTNLNIFTKTCKLIRLDLSIPEYDWFKGASTGYSALTLNPSNSQDAYAINKINELTGLNKLTHAIYDINSLIVSASSYFKLPTASPVTSPTVIIDYAGRRAILGEYQIKDITITYGGSYGVSRMPSATYSSSQIFSDYSTLVNAPSLSDDFRIIGDELFANTDRIANVVSRYETTNNLTTTMHLGWAAKQHNDIVNCFTLKDGQIAIKYVDVTIDEYTANPLGCYPYPITWSPKLECIEFYDETPQIPNFTTDGIIAGKAYKYSDTWDATPAAFTTAGNIANPFETGRRGRYYKQSEYTIKNSVSQNGEYNYVYTSGIIDGTIPIYNPSASSVSPWINSYVINKYLADGKAVSSYDRSGINSAIRYNGAMGAVNPNKEFPAIFGVNANYDDLFFESFEKDDRKTKTVAHTGLYSLDLANNTVPLIVNAKVSANLSDNGAVCRFWIQGAGVPTLTLNCKPKQGSLTTRTFTPTQPLISINGWSLYEVEISDGDFKDQELYSLDIIGSCVIDDIMFKPINSHVSAYSYNIYKNRLDAVLDDDDFATYYQYDGDGNLLRNLKETPMGLRTINEKSFKQTTKVVRDYDHALPMKAPGYNPDIQTPINTPKSPNIDYNAPNLQKMRDLNEPDMFNDKDVNTHLPNFADSIKSKFELFELKIDPNTKKIKYFNLEEEKEKLFKNDSLPEEIPNNDKPVEGKTKKPASTDGAYDLFPILNNSPFIITEKLKILENNLSINCFVKNIEKCS